VYPNRYRAFVAQPSSLVIILFYSPNCINDVGSLHRLSSSLLLVYVLEGAQHYPLAQVFKRWQEYLLRGECHGSPQKMGTILSSFSLLVGLHKAMDVHSPQRGLAGDGGYAIRLDGWREICWIFVVSFYCVVYRFHCFVLRFFSPWPALRH